MKRRDFMGLIGGAAAAGLPLAATAQKSVPVIGFLSTRSARDLTRLIPAFEKGLKETGFTQGSNLSIDHRFADGELKKLPELAADLVRRSVNVLVTTGGAPSAMAAKAATSSIPIVFVIGGDPVELGLAKSLSRPGGNITGMTIIAADLAPKRLRVATRTRSQRFRVRRSDQSEYAGGSHTVGRHAQGGAQHGT